MKGGKILIELSTFIDCSTSTYGGAIYAIYCNCVIKSVCSYICHTSSIPGINSWGQFIYAFQSNGDKNYIHDSSVCSNGIDISGYAAPISLTYGEQKCQSLNVSNYKVKYYSAIFYKSSSASLISYCSLNFNHAIEFECIEFQGTESSSYEISMCNIFNNIQDTSNWGTIYCLTKTEIKECCIGGKLFYANGSTIVIIRNCTLPCSYSITGSITTNNAQSDSSFIVSLKLTEKEGYCFAQYDHMDFPNCEKTFFKFLKEKQEEKNNLIFKKLLKVSTPIAKTMLIVFMI